MDFSCRDRGRRHAQSMTEMGFCRADYIILTLLDQTASAGIFRIPVKEETDDAVA